MKWIVSEEMYSQVVDHGIIFLYLLTISFSRMWCHRSSVLLFQVLESIKFVFNLGVKFFKIFCCSKQVFFSHLVMCGVLTPRLKGGLVDIRILTLILGMLFKVLWYLKGSPRKGVHIPGAKIFLLKPLLMQTGQSVVWKQSVGLLLVQLYPCTRLKSSAELVYTNCLRTVAPCVLCCVSDWDQIAAVTVVVLDWDQAFGYWLLDTVWEQLSLVVKERVTYYQVPILSLGTFADAKWVKLVISGNSVSESNGVFL